MCVAFERLERAVADGLIRYYGAATWEGFRRGSLRVRDLAEAARGIAGERHHFRFIQLPVNIAMTEAVARADLLDAASELGITVVASASLLQARLARNLPDQLAQVFGGLTSDAQ